MIVIVDTGVANRHSVCNALRYLGAEAVVSRDPADLRAASKLILPGVGAFEAGMCALGSRGLIEPLTDEVKGKGKTVLGLCLGMQLMAEASEEGGSHTGLGWIPGQVRRLTPDIASLKVPHVGFNSTTYREDCPLFAGLPQGADFYYVHSYRLDCPSSIGAAWCDHGGRFISGISVGNIHGVQFHPEKSQSAGLALLRNFVENC